MLGVINKFKNEIFLTVLVFIFSIFINRSVTFESHSLGENLKLYSQNFQTQLVYFNHIEFYYVDGKISKFRYTNIKSSFLYLVYLCTHNVFNQNKHTQKTFYFVTY